VLTALAGSERRAGVLEITQPPPGWVDFCARQPSESQAPRRYRASLPSPGGRGWTWFGLTPGSMRLSNRLPILDTGEWSTAGPIPDDGYGDCEDYVLLKRRMLIQSGWPREALLVTVVRNEKDEGHAVLTVTTDKGDYILDNENKRTRTSCSGQRPAINS